MSFETLLLFLLGLGLVILVVVYGQVAQAGQGSAIRRWFGGSEGSEKLKAMIEVQRENPEQRRRGTGKLVTQAGKELDLPEARLKKKDKDLAKKLYYARLPLSPGNFLSIKIASVASACAFVIFVAPGPLVYPMLFLAVMLPQLILNTIVNRRINKRTAAFDKDYVELLLTLVSLLKTGMGPLMALEAASKNLDDDSVCKEEIDVLMERLRLGLTEEQAIGSFAEDVNHPETELFIQSLLLSRSAGGKLSDTLERLAKQVRKRQQFRKQAKGAIAMEKGSMFAVATILGSVVVFVFLMSADLRDAVFQSDMGLLLFGCCVDVVIVGFIWMTKVADIKV